jgi:hypothetical protein
MGHRGFIVAAGPTTDGADRPIRSQVRDYGNFFQESCHTGNAALARKSSLRLNDRSSNVADHCFRKRMYSASFAICKYAVRRKLQISVDASDVS